jgi:hypothetical protein
MRQKKRPETTWQWKTFLEPYKKIIQEKKKWQRPITLESTR